jgi:hypothetical protein
MVIIWKVIGLNWIIYDKYEPTTHFLCFPDVDIFSFNFILDQQNWINFPLIWS